MNIRHCFYLLLIIFATTNCLLARSPAIEPIVGLSIDDAPISEPEKESAFSFSSLNEAQNNVIDTIDTKVADNQILVEKSSELVTSFPFSKNPIPLILVIMLIPIGIWFGLMYRLKDRALNNESNILVFKKKQKNKEKESDRNNDSDKSQYTKAS